MSPEFKRVLVFLVLVFIAMFAAMIFSEGAVQRKNMRIAREHGERILRRLEGNPKFREVIFQVSTDESLSLIGTVENQARLEEIKGIVDSTKPPCPINWQIMVGKP